MLPTSSITRNCVTIYAQTQKSSVIRRRVGGGRTHIAVGVPVLEDLYSVTRQSDLKGPTCASSVITVGSIAWRLKTAWVISCMPCTFGWANKGAEWGWRLRTATMAVIGQRGWWGMQGKGSWSSRSMDWIVLVDFAVKVKPWRNSRRFCRQGCNDALMVCTEVGSRLDFQRSVMKAVK